MFDRSAPERNRWNAGHLAFGLHDEVDQLVFHNDGLDHLHGIQQLLHLIQGKCRIHTGLVVAVYRDSNSALKLAAYLDGQSDLGLYGLTLIVRRPGLGAGHAASLGVVAQGLPQLLHQMGGEGGEHQQQGPVVPTGEALGVKVVDQGHKGGNGGVELHVLDVAGDLFDGPMDGRLVVGGVLRPLLELFAEVPHPVQELLAALHRLVGPGGGLLKVANEHDIEPHGVGAVVPDDVVGVDHVAQGLGHLHRRTQGLAAVLAEHLVLFLLGLKVPHIMGIFAQDHAVAGALGVGLSAGDHADVVEEIVPEAGVKQVEGGVLHAAVVPVHLAPVVQGLLGGQSLVVMGVHIPQEVPGGARPLGHGVGLPPGGAAAAGAGSIHPVGHLGDGGLAVVGGLVGLHLGKQQGELILGDGLPAALLTVDHGDGLAPVPLAGEDPIPELVVDLGVADALLLQPLGNDGDGPLDGEAVEEVGVDQDAGVILGGEGLLLYVLAAGDHLDDLAAELLGKSPVAGVVGGDGHDGAGAVGGEDIVGDKNGNLPTVYRVDGPDALEHHASLFLVSGQLGTLEVALPGGGGGIGLHILQIGELVRPLLHIGMLWRNDHISGAEQGVRPGGVDHDVIAGGGLEGDLCTGGAADPVALLGLDPLDIVHGVQAVQELLGVVGDLEHPLTLFLADHGSAAALADPLYNFLIGQHAFAGSAPVHRHSGLVGQAVLPELEENPLGPLVIAGVSGVNDPVPVKGVAQHVKLPGEILDVLLCDDRRMHMILNGKILRGQAEGVEADGEQDVKPVHSLFPGDHVHGGIGPGMAHMEACGGGIRKFHQSIELRLVSTIFTMKGLLCQPSFLPFGLDRCEIVLQSNHTFLYFCISAPGPAGRGKRCTNSMLLYLIVPVIARGRAGAHCSFSA